MLPIVWKREFRESVSKSYSNEDGAPVMPETFVSELGKCAGTHLLLSAPSATLLTQGIRGDSGTLASPASSQGAATKGLLPRMAEQPRTQLLLPDGPPHSASRVLGKLPRTR